MSRLASPLSALAVVGASVALVACGSSSSDGSAGTKTTAAGQAGAGNQSAAFQKFQDCLKDHGATLPDRGARQGGGGYGPPAGGDGGAPPAGTGTDGGPGAGDPKTAAAMKACAKLRPQGLGNRGAPGAGAGRQDIKAFTPYLTCLKDAGLDVKVADGFNALRDLKRDDPEVQAALKSCQSKIPTRPQPSSTTPGSTT